MIISRFHAAARGAFLIVTAAGTLAAQQPSEISATPIANSYRAVANRLIDAALADSAAWNRTARLTDTFGHRLSGSRALESALDWILAEMKRDGLENVRGEPVMVPHWVRGNESAVLVKPRAQALNMIGLGRSVGTPRGGITAPVLVVSSFADLESKASQAKGKIVLFDVPFTSYGATVSYRSAGASAAAKAGAVAALVRSVASFSIQSPHTGSMSYDSTVAKIPAAALSVEDAMMLHRMSDRGEEVIVTLKMDAKTLPDARSRNVVAEIVGSEKPDEIVVLGGHIDSWDVGQGAMDDAGGSVAAWEAVRLMKKLGLRPRRTVRVVLWTNEENGLRGATGYRDAHIDELDKHVMAMESDNGVFKPSGVSVASTEAGVAMARDIASLLSRFGAASAVPGGPQADIGPLHAAGVPTVAPVVDGSRYFWYHHSAGDTMDKLNPREVAECVALMAVMAYVIADMPGTLPRVVPAAR